MFKKITKKATVATMLLSSLTTTGVFAQHSHLDSVQQNANAVHALAKKNASVEEVFTALMKLSNSIENVTQFLAQRHFKMTKDNFNILVAIRQLLDMNSTLLIAKYEKDILATYSQVYRQYSLNIKHLDDAIYQVRENLGLVHIVDINGLSLSEQDLKIIHQQAKTRAS